MTAIDATGLRALQDISERLRAAGRTAIFCGAREQPRAVMRHSDFRSVVGEDNICPHVQAALDRAKQVVESGPVGTGASV